MKEIVIISGKGGTGKTSLVACFAALARNAVLADCDVDAADLHLILRPRTLARMPFYGGKRAEIDADVCTGCGTCVDLCRFDAIESVAARDGAPEAYRVDPTACEGCGVCAWFCPEKAVRFERARNGEYYVSETDHGPLVHARLGAAQENSGKLVSTVRARACEVAERRGYDLVIIDGAPGVGCPVIASVADVDLALIVTEPTLSGRHDLGRVVDLLRHFGIPGSVVVNKHDLNPGMSDAIADDCRAAGLPVLGRIGYSRDFIAAMVAGRSVVEHARGPVVEEIESIWTGACRLLADGAGTQEGRGSAGSEQLRSYP